MHYIFIKIASCTDSNCDQRKVQVGERMKLVFDTANEAYSHRCAVNNETNHKYTCQCKWDVKEIEE